MPKKWMFTSIAVLFAAIAYSGRAALADDETVQIIRGVEYAQRDGAPLKADVFMPTAEGRFPGVLVIHGGAWMSGTRTLIGIQARQMAEHGYTAISIDYRLAPRFCFPAQYDDCRAALDWMFNNAEKYKVDPTRIGGFGYSAGAQLVALLGLTSSVDRAGGDVETNPAQRLKAVVAGGAPCDFRAIPPQSRLLAYWLGGCRAEKESLYSMASPAAFVSKAAPPFFFFHGEADSLVPLSSPQAMVRELSALDIPVELFIVPQAGHIGAFFSSQALEKSIQFLDEHLKEPRPNPAG